jgi:hypothetical protein
MALGRFFLYYPLVFWLHSDLDSTALPLLPDRLFQILGSDQVNDI